MMKKIAKKITLFIYRIKLHKIFLIFYPKLTYKIEYNKFFLKNNEEYLKISIGSDRNLLGHVNILNRKVKWAQINSDYNRIPISNNEVGDIKYFYKSGDLKHLGTWLLEWWRILIPGGNLIIELKNGEEFKDIDKVINLLTPSGYKIFKNDDKGLIKAYKYIEPETEHELNKGWLEQRKKETKTLDIEWRRDHIHNLILEEEKENIFNNNKILSVGCGTGELEILQARNGFNITGIDLSGDAISYAKERIKNEEDLNLEFIQGGIKKLPFEDNSYDSAYSIEVIEHLSPDQLTELIEELKRVVKPGGKILFTTPYKNAYFTKGHVRFFTKGILAKNFDEYNLEIIKLDLVDWGDKYRDKHSILKIIIKNSPLETKTKKEKICAIGAYDVAGYNMLGFHWDGQKRAFKRLGYKTLFLDYRLNKDDDYIIEKINNYKPDILWLGVKECLDLLENNRNEFKKIKENGCKIIYWYCDPNYPNKRNLKGLLDIMFVTNKGQEDEYKRAYKINRVYYMPQAFDPAFIRSTKNNEIYLIGFTGLLTGIIHKKRKQIIKKLINRYKLEVRGNRRNHLSNFYSKCKIVFGMNPDFERYLYTSNRFYIAIGSGALYLCEYFEGIEKLAKNNKHVVWFKNEKELIDKIDYLLKNKKKRFTIKENARKLALENHTYKKRIQNMIDIINNKTEKFSGYLN